LRITAERDVTLNAKPEGQTAMEHTDQQRVDRIVSRAFAAFAHYTSDQVSIPIGTHSTAVNGMPVKLAVQKSHCTLTITGPDRHGADDQTLFEGLVLADGSSEVTCLDAGTWEARFVAAPH
jgi:hypothetical protein